VIKHKRARHERLGSFGGTLMILAVIAHGGSASAETITVTTVADGIANDGNRTPREAVIAASSDSAVDTGGAGPGADVAELGVETYTLSGTGAAEPGGLCVGVSPSACQFCGDGLIVGSEACDDGDLTAGDGCSAGCAVEPGWTCRGSPSSCATTCNDSIIAGSETCDDGGRTGGDGCSATCAVERGWSCAGSPSACATVCGDGIIIGLEVCDDADRTAGDGCSAICRVEATWICSGAPSRCLRDTDGDRVFDSLDNCVDTPNGAQYDSDGDRRGDVCDSDIDGNGYDENIHIGGGGCAAGGSGSGLALALVLGALMARRRRALAGLAGLLVIGSAGIGHAQLPATPHDFAVERFHWTAARSGVLGAESGAVIADHAWDVGMWIGTADDMLVVSGPSGSAPLVSRRTTATWVGAVGIRDHFELSVTVPLVLDQVGATSAPGVTAMLGSLTRGFGDLGMSGKVAVLRQDTAGVAVAVLSSVTAPTGQWDYRGEHGVTFTPALAVSRSSNGLTVAGNFGWRMRQTRMMADLRIDDELTLELGAAYQVDPVVALKLGWSEAAHASSPFRESNQTHGEVLGGATFQFGSALLIEAIVGAGIQHGFGTPDWRGVLAVRYGR
jgi:cysteine-rich repeat protein